MGLTVVHDTDCNGVVSVIRAKALISRDRYGRFLFVPFVGLFLIDTL